MRSRIFLTAIAALAVVPVTSLGQTSAVYNPLYSFSGSDGSNPAGALIQAADGNYYGTTTGGGANGGGVVYKVDANGNFTSVYTFPAGTLPSAGPLFQGADGNLYGTTDGGGDLTGCGGAGCGFIYQLTPSGTLTVLYKFAGSDADQMPPHYGVIQGTDGNFYGLSNGGTAIAAANAGNGEAFQLVPNGAGSTYNVLYHFCQQASCADGQGPMGNLLQASDGNFYGTAQAGGGNAVAFQITSGTTPTFNLFYQFPYAVNGTLIEFGDSSLYGTAPLGNSGSGEIYQITNGDSGAQVTPVFNFTGTYDGANPNYPLLVAGDGNIYGTTSAGGNVQDCSGNGCGTAFLFSPAGGTLQTLYSFTGAGSDAGMLQGADANFYSTSYSAGGNGGAYQILLYPTVPPPIQITVTPQTGGTATLNWSVANAFSATMQQCYAFINGAVAPSSGWTGLQTGTVVNGVYSGSATVNYNAGSAYSLTCGGSETGSTAINPTNTSLTFSPAPVVSGQTESVTITVTSSAQVVNEGAVTLSCPGVLLGPVNVVNGQGVISSGTSGVPDGTYSCSATYDDPASTFGASLGIGTIIVGKQQSSVQVTSNSPVGLGARAVIKATVQGQVSTPTGTVTFSVNGTIVKTAVLVNGVATIAGSTSRYAPGNYTIVATYNGDNGTKISNSSTTYVILPLTTTTLSADNQDVVQGTPVTFTANVAGSGTPTGTVSFYADGSYLLGSALLQSGTATYIANTTNAPPGTYTITAVYSGDQSNSGSTSAGLSVTIQSSGNVKRRLTEHERETEPRLR